jgi:type II secretory pathway component PulF
MEHRPTDSIAARRVIEQKVLRAHLAKVLEGGSSILPALRAFSEEVPAGRRRNELHALIRILEQGSPEEAERAFADLPDYWIPLLSAAISSSDPGRILHQFLRETRRTDELRRQWWMTLTYPVLVACIAVAVMILLSVLVIPVFREVFRDFGLMLPAVTRINLAVAGLIAKFWPLIVIALAAIIGVLIYLTLHGKSLPFGISNGFFGFFGRTTAVAQMSQFIADLLEAGLSPFDSLKVAGLLTNRERLRDSVWRLADQLQVSPAAAMHLKPPRRMATVYYALRADMSTETRIRLLRETTQAFTEMTKNRLSWTRGLIEPLTILLIGFMVGVVVFSLFAPLFNLINGLSK